VTFPSCFVHAGCIPQDMQLGGNRSTGRGSALTKYYKGGKMTAAEMAHVKNFFRLPKEATKEQVSFVAAAVTFQAARDKRAGASRQNEAATPAVAKKKMLLPSWFCAKSTPSPAQSKEDHSRGTTMECSHCAGTVVSMAALQKQKQKRAPPPCCALATVGPWPPRGDTAPPHAALQSSTAPCCFSCCALAAAVLCRSARRARGGLGAS